MQVSAPPPTHSCARPTVRFTLAVMVRVRVIVVGRSAPVSTESASDEAALLAANEAFYTAFNAKDAEAMAAVWARAAPVVCIHPGWNILSGREDVLTSWQAILTNPNQPRIVSGGGARICGDVGIVVCRELVSGNPLAATNIFIREDGAWRMLHHHSSPVMQIGG